MKKTNKKLLDQLTKIAQSTICTLETRNDLETHHSDEEDFVDVAVWELRAALIEAYELGKKSR